MWIERAIDFGFTIHDKQSHITCKFDSKKWKFFILWWRQAYVKKCSTKGASGKCWQGTPYFGKRNMWTAPLIQQLRGLSSFGAIESSSTQQQQQQSAVEVGPVRRLSTRCRRTLAAEEMTVQISAPQSAQFSRLQAARPQLLDCRLHGGSGTRTQGPPGALPRSLSDGNGRPAVNSSFFVVTVFSQCWPPWSGQLGAGPAAGLLCKTVAETDCSPLQGGNSVTQTSRWRVSTEARSRPSAARTGMTPADWHVSGLNSCSVDNCDIWDSDPFRILWLCP